MKAKTKKSFLLILGGLITLFLIAVNVWWYNQTGMIDVASGSDYLEKCRILDESFSGPWCYGWASLRGEVRGECEVLWSKHQKSTIDHTSPQRDEALRTLQKIAYGRKALGVSFADVTREYLSLSGENILGVAACAYDFFKEVVCISDMNKNKPATCIVDEAKAEWKMVDWADGLKDACEKELGGKIVFASFNFAITESGKLFLWKNMLFCITGKSNSPVMIPISTPEPIVTIKCAFGVYGGIYALTENGNILGLKIESEDPSHPDVDFKKLVNGYGVLNFVISLPFAKFVCCDGTTKAISLTHCNSIVKEGGKGIDAISYHSFWTEVQIKNELKEKHSVALDRLVILRSKDVLFWLDGDLWYCKDPFRRRSKQIIAKGVSINATVVEDIQSEIAYFVLVIDNGVVHEVVRKRRERGARSSP